MFAMSGFQHISKSLIRQNQIPLYWSGQEVCKIPQLWDLSTNHTSRVTQKSLVRFGSNKEVIWDLSWGHLGYTKKFMTADSVIKQLPATAWHYFFFFFCLYAVFDFLQTCCCKDKHLYLGLICWKDIVPDVLWFIQRKVCKILLTCSFQRNQVFPFNLSKQAFLFHCFSNCPIIIFNIEHAVWGL